MKTSTYRAQYSREEFKQLIQVRVRQLEAHQDASSYAPVLAALRQSMEALQSKGATSWTRG